MNIAQTNSSPIDNFIKWAAPYALVAVSFFAGKEEAKGQTDFIPNVGYVPSGSVQQDYSRPQIFLQENARLPQRQAHVPAPIRPVVPVYQGGYYQQLFLVDKDLYLLKILVILVIHLFRDQIGVLHSYLAKVLGVADIPIAVQFLGLGVVGS